MTLENQPLPDYVQQELDSISTDYQEKVLPVVLANALNTVKQQCQAILQAGTSPQDEIAQSTLKNCYSGTRELLDVITNQGKQV